MFWLNFLSFFFRTGEESVALSDCLQLAYLPSARHHLLALFPREVMILDMEINQAVCSFSLERNSPSFLQVIPCQQRDVLMCLHENGSVIMRVRRRVENNPYFIEPGDEASNDVNTSVDILYENKCQSDPLRLSKSSRLFGFMCCPTSERKVALLISDGRMIIWELKATRLQNTETSLMSEEALKASLPCDTDPEHLQCNINPNLTLANVIPPPLTSGSVIPNSTHYKFIMVSLSNTVSSPPTCSVMCPPLTTKNWANYKPLLAVGKRLVLILNVRFQKISMDMNTREGHWKFQGGGDLKGVSKAKITIILLLKESMNQNWNFQRG